MEAKVAYERIYRDTQGAISILSLMAEHMTGQAVDPRLVSTVEAVAHMLDSNQDAFDAIDGLIRRVEFLAEVEQYTDEQMDAMCQGSKSEEN